MDRGLLVPGSVHLWIWLGSGFYALVRLVLWLGIRSSQRALRLRRGLVVPKALVGSVSMADVGWALSAGCLELGQYQCVPALRQHPGGDGWSGRLPAAQYANGIESSHRLQLAYRSPGRRPASDRRQCLHATSRSPQPRNRCTTCRSCIPSCGGDLALQSPRVALCRFGIVSSAQADREPRLWRRERPRLSADTEWRLGALLVKRQLERHQRCAAGAEPVS